MEPLVSVIVPLYNCGQYIKKCVKSILEQTYNNIQVIVVNDGSSDNSDEVMQQLAEENENILYIVQENQGVAQARNIALRKAKGKYILFVDADDYLDRSYISNLVDCAEKLNAELVVSGYTMEYEKGNKKVVIVPKEYYKIENEIWVYRISSTGGRLYSKEFWDKYNLEFIQEKGARAEDVPIALFANAMANNIGVIPNAGYNYLQHSGSAMNNKEKKVIFLFPYIAFKEMYEKVMEATPNNSKYFYDLGILKFLAQFEFVIYRYVDRNEKQKFRQYILTVLQDDLLLMIEEWKVMRKKVELPVWHKAAIQLFVWKYHKIYKLKADRGKK